MKRLTSLILALVLVVGTFAVPALAAGEEYTFSLTVNDGAEASVMVGDTITVALKVKNNKTGKFDLYSMQDRINFDPAYLEYIPGTEQFLEQDDYPVISGTILPGGRQVFTNRAALDPVSVTNGEVLMQFQLKAKKAGTAAITSSNPEMIGENGLFSVALVDAAVTISQPHVHTMKQVPEVPATEKNPGQKAHWTCTGCGKLFLDQQGKKEASATDLLIPQLKHTHVLVHNPGKKPTETLLGLKEHWTCSGCGKHFLDENGTQEVPEADLILPKTEHVHTLEAVPEVPATEQAAGRKAHWLCTGCGKLFLDEAATQEVQLQELEIPQLGKKPAASTGFTDVPADAWYAEAVSWAVEHNITQGISATAFGPEAPCTRAQAVTFLWRAAGSPAPARSSCPFTDVPADAYYRSAVLWALENGVTQGISDTAFGPDLICTRGQIVTFLWRAKGAQPSAASLPFTDVAADDWYAEAVSWAVQQNVTQGVSDTAFAPGMSCTRGHIVTFLWRAQ